MKGMPKDLRGTILTLLSYMGRHAKRFGAIAVLVAVSALANLFGTYMIKPVINAASSETLSRTWMMIAVMACIYLCGVLASYGYTRMLARGAQMVVYDIRRDLFSRMCHLPVRTFDTMSHGELMSRFTNDVDTVSDALNNSFAMSIQSFIQAAGTLVLLFVLNWKLSCIVLVFYLLVFAYIFLASKTSGKYFARQQESMGVLNGFAEEMISGLRVVKVFNREKANEEEFKKVSRDLEASAENALRFSQTMVPSVVSISYVNYAIVAVVGGFMVLRGQFDVGGLASYLVFVRQAAMPINQFVNQANLMLAALAGAERIFGFLRQEEEKNEGHVTLAWGVMEDGQWKESPVFTGNWVWKHPRKDGSVEYVPLQGEVSFEHVDFGYMPQKKVLKDFSLYARPGQTIALVGSTGAGKTTITNLLNRFYDVDQGSILFDGIDIRLINKDDLRKSMAMVLQDTHLFSESIRENIRFGNLNASDEAITDAARLANASSFIERMPEGYDTMLSSDGASLSAGQRQLLSIARAAISNPPVLVLDEATSNIDTRTESLIEKGMNALMKGRTTFVIAHRLSTIRNADCIVVLENGQILEKGTHEQLLEKNGRYAQLYQGLYELD